MSKYIDTTKFTQVKSPAGIPKGVSYIIQFYIEKVVHHEGDERSRTHPGHRYPSSTERFLAMEQYVTANRDNWIEQIKLLHLAAPKDCQFSAFKVEQPYVTVDVQVNISNVHS